MSIKRLLPLAGILALVAACGGTGPSCYTNQPQIVSYDDQGNPVWADRWLVDAECQDAQDGQ